MSFLSGIVITSLGLIIGSFLNAVLWRLRVRRSVVKGRSMCPRCKHVLGPADLIPLFSFVWLRGRCRYCHRTISWWYPAVELAAAGLYLASWLRWGASPELLLDLVIWPFLIVIFAYDWRWSLILDRISLPGAALAFLANLLLGRSFIEVLAGAILGGAFFGLQYFLSRGRWVGGGDMRLGLLIGALLGWPGVLLCLGLAYSVGAVVGIALIIARRKTWQSVIPFGTFLTAAAVAIRLLGYLVMPYFT